MSNAAEAKIQQAAQIREQSRADFVLLARRVALGEDIEPGEIASVCRDAGKEADEFASLVRSLRHRAQLRIQAAAREGVEKEIAENERLRAESWAKVEEESRRHERFAGPLFDRWTVLTRQLAEIRCLPSDLANSCPDPALNNERRRLELEGRQLGEQLRDAQDQVARMEGQLAVLPPDSEDTGRFKRALIRAEQAFEAAAERVGKNSVASNANHQARIDF